MYIIGGVSNIDKVYTDGPCGSKTIVRVLLARFKRESHVTHSRAYTILLGSGIFQLKCLRYDWAQEFPYYKKCLASNFSIDLLISNSHGPSMHTLSMDITKEFKFIEE